MKKIIVIAALLIATGSAVTLSKDSKRKPAVETINLSTAQDELSHANAKPVKSTLGNGDGSLM